MIAKFNIQVDLNGWLIPFHIERKGYGIFKVLYENTILGHLMVNDSSKWIYLNNIAAENLLNPYTANKISEAIIHY